MNVIQQRVTELVDPHIEIELLADGFLFTEGPVWSFRDPHLTFSDIPGDTMCRWDEREGLREYRKPSAFSNGLAYDADGALVACEHRTRRVTRENCVRSRNARGHVQREASQTLYVTASTGLSRASTSIDSRTHRSFDERGRRLT